MVGTVYLAATRSLQYVRIGWSANLDKSFSDLSELARTWGMVFNATKTAEPDPLTLVSSHAAPREFGAYLRERWKTYRLRLEWFRFESQLRLWALEAMESEVAWEDALIDFRKPRIKATIQDHPAMRAVNRGRPEQDVKICSSCWGHDGVHRTWCHRA